MLYHMESRHEALELRTCCNQSLASLVAFVLGEVLDESASQILCLLVPLGSFCIGITRIQDCRIYARKLSRNFKVEVRDSLGRSILDVAIKNSIDNFVSSTLKTYYGEQNSIIVAFQSELMIENWRQNKNILL